MADQKVSLLVNRQVPEYIREEYPVFISFLEAYYEFLENKQGTQLNDLTTKTKNLKTISDVDDSIEEFEQQFFNSYASMIPRDAQMDKAALIKNVLPLYLSKGSEKSFQLLFRMLFSQELELSYPKNQVLRASDGKWVIDNAVKVTNDIYSTYTADGTKDTFLLLEQLSKSDFEVYVDGVLTTDFEHRKETKKIIFNDVPNSGAKIRVLYKSLTKNIFANRKITGSISGATALVEKVYSKLLQNKRITELYVDSKTLIGEFKNGEKVTTDVVADDGSLINVEFQTVSSVLRINISDGGSNYNVGDPVIITSEYSTTPASAIITKTFKGTITKVSIAEGGSGFQAAGRVAAIGYEPTELDFGIATVAASSNSVYSTYTIYSDVISDIDPSNTTISSSDWNFSSTFVPAQNLSTVIADAMSNISYTAIGGIDTISILTAESVVTTTPTLNAAPAVVEIPHVANTSTNTSVKIDTFGALGKIIIVDGGSNYEIDDEIVFTNKPMSYGIGAEAEVSNVSTTGAITEIRFVPTKISGNVSTTSISNVMVVGTGTAFTTELKVGENIMVNGEKRKVVVISSDTSLNVDSYFSVELDSRPIRKFGIQPIGGHGYKQNKLPDATVNSATGSDAVLEVVSVLGDGEDLLAAGDKRPGEIQEITITDSGTGYYSVPLVDLTLSGDGTAVANASLTPSYESFDGRWTSSDSILSSSDRKLQGRDYFVDYSYLITSDVEFAKYKKIFKELLHPAGFKAYAELRHLDVLDATKATANTLVAPTTIRTLSGLVDIEESSIYVTGHNTKFEVANTLGLISVGAYIAVNSQIRVVNSIISNTNLSVTSAYTITATNQELVVMNTAYNAVATEITLDEIIAENEFVLTVEE